MSGPMLLLETLRLLISIAFYLVSEVLGNKIQINTFRDKILVTPTLINFTNSVDPYAYYRPYVY